MLLMQHFLEFMLNNLTVEVAVCLKILWQDLKTSNIRL
jgi:hypothetical protein